MRIAKFWAKGYRSLGNLTLDQLGDFNVFYGPNGSGKSNVLVAMRTLFDLAIVLGAAARQRKVQPGTDSEFAREAGRTALSTGILQQRDLRVGDPAKAFVLGAVCQAVDVEGAVDTGISIGPRVLREVLIEVVVDWQIQASPRVAFSLSLDGDEVDFNPIRDRAYSDLCVFLTNLGTRAYALVGADRMPRFETTTASAAAQGAVAWHLREGRLKNALFVAQNSPDAAMRHRSRILRALLEEPPLERQPFDVVQDPVTQEIDVREPLPGGEVSIDLAGLGVAQLYSMLAHVVLVDGRAVGIEEPEAHLHAPTSGRKLRVVLQRVVERHIKTQLFIATHSNLFDLDPTGYWDVSMLRGETQVHRKPLHELDALHLYEPGPAKHALAQLLRYAPADEPVFRRPDGAVITAANMLTLLAADDDLAVDFLRNLHGAAMRVMRLDARGEKDSK